MVRAARELVEQDRRHYEAVWEDLQATHPVELTQLAQSVAETYSRYATSTARQCRAPPPDGFDDEDALGLGSGSLAPETCLGRVLEAAVRADPLLRAKVTEWSSLTGGLHTLDPGGWRPARWERMPAAGTPERAWVRWAEVKGVERAAEKAVRAYGGDPSRILDAARQCIVHDDPAGVAAGLRAIAADGEVALVRVKSRLRGDYDAAATAGYRDVLVNVRLLSAEAARCKVYGHVCEVRARDQGGSLRFC
jgi:hypothetical protein